MLHQYGAEVQAERKEKQENDFLLSFEELKRRAEAGNSSAQYLVGRALWAGDYGSVKSRPAGAEGTKWIISAKNDEDSPGGLCAQGSCYMYAIGGVVIKNADKAKECYSKAVEQGYIPAFYDLGVALRDEAITKTTTESTAKVVTPGQLASTATNTQTHTHKDVEKLATAIKLITAAAEAGYPPAIVQLAYCYAEGHGVTKDYKESLRLYRMGAEKGSAYAKRQVGAFYANARNATLAGVAQNKAEAKKWYLEAEAQGYDVTEDLRRNNPTSSCSLL